MFFVFFLGEVKGCTNRIRRGENGNDFQMAKRKLPQNSRRLPKKKTKALSLGRTTE